MVRLVGYWELGKFGAICSEYGHFQFNLIEGDAMLLIKYLKNIGNIGQVRCLLTEQKEIATLKHNLQRAFDLLNRSEDCKYLMSEINHVQFVPG